MAAKIVLKIEVMKTTNINEENPIFDKWKIITVVPQLELITNQLKTNICIYDIDECNVM